MPRHEIAQRRHELERNDVRIAPGEAAGTTGRGPTVQQLAQLRQQHAQDEHLRS